MPNKIFQKSKSRKLTKENTDDFSNLWLQWEVVKDSEDSRDLMSFDFKLIEKNIDSTTNHKVAIPILALYHIAEKYSWLQILRGSRHRPKDPYELVHFIQMLGELRGME